MAPSVLLAIMLACGDKCKCVLRPKSNNMNHIDGLKVGGLVAEGNRL